MHKQQDFKTENVNPHGENTGKVGYNVFWIPFCKTKRNFFPLKQ